MAKELHVTMPDGSVWAVPVQIVIDNWTAYYMKERPDEFPDLETTKKYTDEYFKDDFEVVDWAANNMNWHDVYPFARPVQGTPIPDYQEGWVNGAKAIVEGN